MSIPQFHEIFLPLLSRSAAGRKWPLAALRSPIVDEFGLSDAGRARRLGSTTPNNYTASTR